MREKDRYIGTREIREILNCSKGYANEIMHMFDYRGQMYRTGNRLKVKERVFQDWLRLECKQKY